MQTAAVTAVIATIICGTPVAASEPVKVQAAHGWSPQMDADVRLRGESIVRETSPASPVDHRLRLRVRAGLGGRFVHTLGLSMGGGMVTGPANYPSSRYYTLATDTAPAAVVDRAYLRWDSADFSRPLRVGAAFTLGRFANPVRRRSDAVGVVWSRPSELVLDSDVPLTGAAQALHVPGGWSVRTLQSIFPGPTLNLVQKGMPYVVGAQLSWARRVGVQADASVGALSFGNTRRLAAAVASGALSSDFSTNTIVGAGERSRYARDFRLLTASLTLQLASVPLGISGEAVANPAGATRAVAGDVGVAGGLYYGECARPRTFRVTLGMHHIDPDAVLAVFNSDDLQQTGVWGSSLDARIQVAQRVVLVLDSYLQRPTRGQRRAARVKTRLTVQAALF